MKKWLADTNTWMKAFFRFLSMSIALYPVYTLFLKNVLTYFFRQIIRHSGYYVLNKENLLHIVKQPVMVIAILFFALVACAIIFSEFSLLLYSVVDELHWDQLKTFFRERIWSKCKQLCSPEIFLFLLYLALMIPLANLGLNSSILAKWKIPDFIGNEFMKSKVGMLGYGGLLVLVAYINLRLLYFIPLFSLTKRGVKQSLVDSWHKTKGKTLLHMAYIILYFIVAAIVLIAISASCAILFSKWDPMGTSLVKESLFFSILTGAHYAVDMGLKFVLIMLMVQIHEKSAERKMRPLYQNIRLWVVVAGIISLFVTGGIQLFLLEDQPTALKISHRGDSASYVENSLEALISASKKGADFVEMDVLMTKDKQFVVFHDRTLKRMANLNQKVSELTLEQLQRLTIRNEAGQTSRIPSLKEYIETSNALNQALFLELKPEKNKVHEYMQAFIKQYQALKPLEKNRLISLNLVALMEAKKEIPSIQTGYIIPFQLGSLEDYPVDFYVVEEFSYNYLFALSAKKQKKQIFVWTINKEKQMKELLFKGVDGILTDDISTLSTIIKEMMEQNYYKKALQLMEVKS
ncbi:glycerophosphodiester phosphodiesterase [Bulleidia sp. zg-1006]|uniref:glycerophosphodiester phosphodiesterase n=1 Tax=Bulleidia sp. zg-1006 TaxID=2806552 RepID=UPI0019393D48|nr:glycerophosphodiester phosphodiesterase [Bulleidia sp. zg-1006]QRG87204.1 glycerophosphodiester phosphodiesterase [Bulleidia sp. zg-1006]